MTDKIVFSQLPASSRTVFESWTLVFRRPTRRLTRWTRLLGCTVVKTTETEPGKIVAVSPNTHFEQEDLAQMVIAAKTQHKPRPLTSRGYDDDLEHRLRKQDETVQNELFSLLRDRTESASNPYRHREYKFAVLEVSGGKMTDASSRPRAKKHWWQGLQKSKYTKASHIEYRVVLRGHEMRANDAGWAVYDRFSQPWRLADEAGLARTREKMGYQTLLG